MLEIRDKMFKNCKTLMDKIEYDTFMNSTAYSTNFGTVVTRDWFMPTYDDWTIYIFSQHRRCKRKIRQQLTYKGTPHSRDRAEFKLDLKQKYIMLKLYAGKRCETCDEIFCSCSDDLNYANDLIGANESVGDNDS